MQKSGANKFIGIVICSVITVKVKTVVFFAMNFDELLWCVNDMLCESYV